MQNRSLSHDRVPCTAADAYRDIHSSLNCWLGDVCVHFSLKQKGKERVNWDALRIFQFILVIPVLSVYIVQPSLNVNHLLPLWWIPLISWK